MRPRCIQRDRSKSSSAFPLATLKSLWTARIALPSPSRWRTRAQPVVTYNITYEDITAAAGRALLCLLPLRSVRKQQYLQCQLLCHGQRCCGTTGILAPAHARRPALARSTTVSGRKGWLCCFDADHYARPRHSGRPVRGAETDLDHAFDHDGNCSRCPYRQLHDQPVWHRY